MNNTLRKKIGLKPLLKSWKRIQIKGINVEFYLSESNIIEKAICQRTDEIYYTETDLSIQLNEKGQMITKTGKVKNFTSSIYETIKPNKISVVIQQNKVIIDNHANNLQLIDEYDLAYENLSETFDFIENYIEDKSTYFVKHFKDFRTATKTSRIKIKSGDIFRIPIKRKQFIYGQVISPLRKTIKTKFPVIGDFKTSELKINVFDPNMFFFPLWVRFFTLKTENPYLQKEDFKKLKFTSSTFIGDYSLRHSNYSIIDHLDINTSEIDIPMKLRTIYNNGPEFHIFNWGAGIITLKANEKIEKLINESAKHFPNMKGKGEQKRIEIFINNSKKGKRIFGSMYSSSDLRDDNLSELKIAIFEKLGIDPEISYDEFATQNGFMLTKDIIEMNK